MKLSNHTISVALLFCAFSLHANTHHPFLEEQTTPTSASNISSKFSDIMLSLHHVATLSGGESFLHVGAGESTGHISFLDNFLSYNFQHTSVADNAKPLMWGLFVGSEAQLAYAWALRAGLGYYQIKSIRIDGTLSQTFDGFNVTQPSQAHMENQQLLAETKWLWTANPHIQPYMMIGLGAAFNKNSVALNHRSFLATLLTPSFSNTVQTSFSYAVGPGIDFILFKQVRAGIAYRYADLGSFNENALNFELINIPFDNVQKIHAHSQEILLQLTVMLF